jgi:two-component system phosphate regulon response regulator OmpR
MIFHVAKGELRRDGRIVRLTDSETQLLRILAARAGAPISRHELATLTSAGVERSVDVQVTRLRRKIERDPREPVHLQTVRGVGYRLAGD